MAAVVAATAFAGSADAAVGPSQLYQRLLRTPLVTSQLPPGLSAPGYGWRAPSTLAKSHGAVGHAEIAFGRGHPRIVYLVFKTRGGALGEWKDSDVHRVYRHPVAVPASFPRPAILGNYTNQGTWESSLAFVWKNVIVSVDTQPGTSKVDVAGNVRLARFALQHLLDVASG